MKPLISRRIRPSARRRGFTFVEMLIAITISTLVVTATASLNYFSSRVIYEVYGQSRTRSSRMIALDQLRYRLMNARIGSAVVSQSNHRIEYVDPTVGGVTSAFYFVPTQNMLYYDANINNSTPAVMVTHGPIDVSFTVLNAGEIIQLSVRSSSNLSYAQKDTEDGQTSVYLRNPAAN